MSNALASIQSNFEDTFAWKSRRKIWDAMTAAYNTSDWICPDKEYWVISDLHIGNGTRHADFSIPCESSVSSVLRKCLENVTTAPHLILNGDIIEGWNFTPASVFNSKAHQDEFALMSKLYREHRLSYIFGNHDGLFAFPQNVRKYLHPLFPNITVHEGLRWTAPKLGKFPIFAVHGHQYIYDPTSYRSTASELFLRNVWAPTLRRFGHQLSYQEPAYDKKLETVMEHVYNKWAEHNHVNLLVAHIHRCILDASVPLLACSGCGINDNGTANFLKILPATGDIQLMRADKLGAITEVCRRSLYGGGGISP